MTADTENRPYGGRASRPTGTLTQTTGGAGGQDARPPNLNNGGRASRPTVILTRATAAAGGQDARPPRSPKGFYRRGEKHPPHLDQPGRFQHVTFRLACSLPAEYLERVKRELASGLLTGEEYRARLEEMLDQGHGPRWLGQPEVAQVVQRALEHFDADRYDLHTWCIMPNHVHVLLRPHEGHSLPQILQSWKSFTAKKCNQILGRAGTFWQDDYFDRYMRDQADVTRTAAYILNNGGRASRPTGTLTQTTGGAGGQDARPPPTWTMGVGRPARQVP